MTVERSRTPRIIHISESFAGGVSAAIRDYVRNTSQFEHALIYAARSDAPMNDGDLEGFAFTVELPPGHGARVRTVRRVLRENPGAIVHAHSSFGGLYARVAARKGRTGGLYYTPHCYAFERQDIPGVARLGFRLAEWILAFNTSGFLACSRREADLSNWALARAAVRFIPNVPPHDIAPHRTTRLEDGPIVLAAAGRLGKQKDPEYFVEVVRALRSVGAHIEPVWIGGGDPEVETVLRSAGIAVTGWLERADGLETLRNADVYIHTARWEGFPLAILEVSALGIPALVRDIPAFEGVDLPAIIRRPADAASVWERFSTASGRTEMANAMRVALASYSDANQARALAEAYETELAPRAQKVTTA